MSLVLVDKEALDALLRRTWSMFVLLAEESGYEEMNLEPGSELVVLACQAGLPIPGPLKPGTVPPAPPRRYVDINMFERMERVIRGLVSGELDERIGEAVEICAPTYRGHSDPRLRCTADGKVVYGTEEQAVAAAKRISRQQTMRHYQGQCGHWHVSRDKSAMGAAIAAGMDGLK